MNTRNGMADGIRTHDLQSRSYQAAFAESLIRRGFAVFGLFSALLAKIPETVAPCGSRDFVVSSQAALRLRSQSGKLSQ